MAEEPTKEEGSLGNVETPEVEDRGDVVALGATEEVAEAVEEEVKEEEEVKAEAEPKEEEKAEAHMIPKDRLDQEIAKRRQLENQLKDLQKPVDAPKAPEYDFDKAEKEYMSAVVDGELDKAMAIRKNIRTAERSQMDFEFNQKMETTKVQTRAQIELDNEVNVMTQRYPSLDINGKEADNDLINETNELMSAFTQNGYTAVDALRKAVGYTMKSAGINSTGPAVVPDIARIEANKKKAGASKQPPKLGGESQRMKDIETKQDVSRMSNVEFDKLTDEELKKLRGDVL
tara:strand:+ start:370 stop:1233 length:864 start_codon:yes stop_codon:yes gene_type:complete